MIYLIVYLTLGILYVCMPYTQRQIKESFAESSSTKNLPNNALTLSLQIGYAITIVLFPIILSTDIFSRLIQKTNSKFLIITSAILIILFLMAPYILIWFLL